MASPCGDGYSLIGDICMPTPEGYVETRSECEMGVDSMEAAGVEQDYQAELAKCREEAAAAELPPSHPADANRSGAEAALDASAIEGFFSWLLSEIAEWFASIQIM